MTNWAGRSPPRRRVVLALAVVLAAHLALLVLLNASKPRPARHAPEAARVALRLIAPVPPRAVAAPVVASTAHPPPRERAARVAVPRAITPRPISPVADEVPAPTALAVPAAPASAPLMPPSLLDTEATRRAIRSSARAVSLGEQLAASREEPRRISANDRLAIGVREAGKGDCAKGEYAGAGMGILSLPFLVVAAAAGNCAK